MKQTTEAMDFQSDFDAMTEEERTAHDKRLLDAVTINATPEMKAEYLRQREEVKRLFSESSNNDD